MFALTFSDFQKIPRQTSLSWDILGQNQFPKKGKKKTRKGCSKSEKDPLKQEIIGKK